MARNRLLRKSALSPIPARHQAVAEQLERVTLARLGQRGQQGAEVRLSAEDSGALVAPVRGVVEQAVSDAPWQSRHVNKLRNNRCRDKKKLN
jgi:hypothetical protein